MEEYFGKCTLNNPKVELEKAGAVGVWHDGLGWWGFWVSLKDLDNIKKICSCVYKTNETNPENNN
jgi:hypothetical protein